MYRKIDVGTWSDPVVKTLSAEQKLLFLYLITNPHTHVSGIYYLPVSLMAHELRVPEKRTNTLLDTLSGVENGKLVAYDRKTEVVWVRKMFDHQGQGSKNDASAASQLATLHNSFLIKDFLEFYASRQIPYRYPIDTNPKRTCPVPVPVTVLASSLGTSLLSSNAEIDKVWEHYRTHRPKVRVLGEDVRKKIEARLTQDKFTADELKAAIDGNFRSPHHCGQNEHGTEYHELELIVRDSKHVNQFLAVPANGQFHDEPKPNKRF